jgi:hypothetical protein
MGNQGLLALGIRRNRSGRNGAYNTLVVRLEAPRENDGKSVATANKNDFFQQKRRTARPVSFIFSVFI